jgi:hypothetical protein
MANRYLVLLKFLVNSNSHLNFEFEGKIKFIEVIFFYSRNVEDMLRERGEEVCRVAHPTDRVESAEQLELVPKVTH